MRDAPSARRDGPWLVVDSAAGEVRILAATDDLTGFVDVHVHTTDGQHRVGTFGTTADITQTMARWHETGDCLGGRYFWVADLIVVDRADVSTIVAAVDDLAASGELDALALVPADQE